MKLIFHWLVSAGAIWVAAYIVPNTQVTLKGALVAAVVLGALNLLVRPILFVLTLPITLLTLGLFSLILNAAMVMLASMIVPGFVVVGFWSALLFALVLSVVNWVFHLWHV